MIVQWLSAYILWSFAGGLAVYFGLLGQYDSWLFMLLALGAGIVQYRERARGGRDRAVAVFVGAQLVWLVVILARNGFFIP